jgi:hypothetical protein
LEQAAIVEAAKRIVTRPKPAKVAMKAELVDGVVKVELGSPHDDHNGWMARVKDALGTRSSDFANTEIMRMIGAL